MPTSERAHDPPHPLLEDEDELDAILDVMYAKIHKVLRWPNPGRSASGSGRVRLVGGGQGERAIVGTGMSADDILSEALADLLTTSPDDVRVSWRALAVSIAENKARDAIRRASKGLKETSKRERLLLVSGDTPASGRADDEPGPSILDVQPDPMANPEDEFHAINDVLELINLARELLNERDQEIFLKIHTGSRTRQQLADEFSLTRQRVGQIYDGALESLEADPRYPYGDDTDGA